MTSPYNIRGIPEGTVQESSPAEVHCPKHGKYEVDTQHPEDWAFCPKCQRVKLQDLCTICEDHKAALTVAESTLASIHGFTRRMCRCCHLKIVEKHMEEVTANLTRLRQEIAHHACD